VDRERELKRTIAAQDATLRPGDRRYRVIPAAERAARRCGSTGASSLRRQVRWG
jgi:hypothetical protein